MLTKILRILSQILILIHGHNTERVTESADKDPEDTVTDTAGNKDAEEDTDTETG